MFIYISGAPPGTDIYVDDVVLKPASNNNLILMKMESKIHGNCIISAH